VAHCARKYPQHFRTGGIIDVLEVGSRDVNGSVRDLFGICDYVGVDATEGPGVNVVTLAHEYDGRPHYRQFDTVISCECFEHDPHLDATLGMIHRWVKRPDSLFVATFAGPARLAHGTGDNPYSPQPGYYQGVTIDRWEKLIAGRFTTLEQSAIYDRHGSEVDIYWVGRPR
jgi:hypothetical protein